VLQLIMGADVDGLIGAGRYERGEARQTWRNGYRDHTLDIRLGTLNLKIPKMRPGAYFPGFLEPRKTVETALVAASSCFVNLLQSEHALEQIFWSLTVQSPSKPKPFLSQSIASKPAIDSSAGSANTRSLPARSATLRNAAL
jgi:hypothetical protein